MYNSNFPNKLRNLVKRIRIKYVIAQPSKEGSVTTDQDDASLSCIIKT